MLWDVLRRQQQYQKGECRGGIKGNANKVLDHGGKFSSLHAILIDRGQTHHQVPVLASSVNPPLLAVIVIVLLSRCRCSSSPLPTSRARPPCRQRARTSFPGRFSLQSLIALETCVRCRHRDSFCNWVSLPLCRFLAHNPPAGLDLLKQSSPPIYSSPVDREEHSPSSDFFFILRKSQLNRNIPGNCAWEYNRYREHVLGDPHIHCGWRCAPRRQRNWSWTRTRTQSQSWPFAINAPYAGAQSHFRAPKLVDGRNAVVAAHCERGICIYQWPCVASVVAGSPPFAFAGFCAV